MFGGVVLIAATVAVFLWRVPATYTRIYKNGILTDTVNIAAVTEPFGLLIEGSVEDSSNINYNYLEVEHGRIRVANADCPDGICIRQGWVSGGLLPIVCLPNRLVVTFEGEGSGFNVDAVAG